MTHKAIVFALLLLSCLYNPFGISLILLGSETFLVLPSSRTLLVQPASNILFIQSTSNSLCLIMPCFISVTQPECSHLKPLHKTAPTKARGPDFGVCSSSEPTSIIKFGSFHLSECCSVSPPPINVRLL